MNGREECPMRHPNGNCLVIGGFCTSVNDEYCNGLREAYECGALMEMRRNKWVSVKDRLPEQKWIDYLVATRIQTDGTRGFNIAWLNDDNGVWKSNDEWICDGREIVTHWMPLPELPKEVSE